MGQRKSRLAIETEQWLKKKKILDMKYIAFVALVVATIFVSTSETSRCIPEGGHCIVEHVPRSDLCITRYCRDQKCIKFGTVSDDSETKDPCRKHRCTKNEICTLNQVQCIRAPCGPVGGCANKTEACVE